MKTKYAAWLTAITVLFSGCESLDYVPGDQMSGQTFWQTEDHARQAAVGMYAAMKADWCFGLEFTFDMCSDIADGTTPWADISRGTSFVSNSSGVQNHWPYLYELVHRANTVISHVATMPISQETIDRVTGEAKFLRAMAYFRMLNCWGGVPYYDETCDINEQFANLKAPRSSAEEIRGHIIDDLTDAIKKLPVKWDAADLGRATKGAAYALRDPRLCLNVITPYSHYLGTDAGSSPMDKQFVLADPTKGGAPMEAMAFIRNSEGWNSYFWRKWIPTGNLDGYWGEYNRTPYEFPLIRLGDVILMLAEAYNETGAIDKAVVEVNKIRERVNMPGLNSGPDWLSVSGKEEMAERIRRERAFELAGEGQRYWDLRRWGLLESSVRNATDIFGDLMYTRSYQPRHELWPIPLVELERNTNLTQNQGW